MRAAIQLHVLEAISPQKTTSRRASAAAQASVGSSGPAMGARAREVRSVLHHQIYNCIIAINQSSVSPPLARAYRARVIWSQATADHTRWATSDAVDSPTSA